MSIDMSQFHDTFFEESHEHLDELERILMEMDVDAPDPEELDSIFRAAHSIKGGSGIFGFDALATVTHVMENLLDRLRGGQMTLRREMVDLFLKTSDTLRSILESYRNHDEIDWAAANTTTEALEAVLSGQQNSVSGEGHSAETTLGYGLFETPVVLDEDPGFGFFDEAEVSHTVASAEDDQGFGFFAEPEGDEGPESGIEDEGFGFFSDEDAAEESPQEPVSRTAQTNQDYLNALMIDPEAPDSERASEAQQQPRGEHGRESEKVPSDSTGRKTAPKSQSAPAAEDTSGSVKNEVGRGLQRSGSAGVAKKPETGAAAAAPARESSSIRVDINKVDQLVNLVGELVITQSMIGMIGEEVGGSVGERLGEVLADLERNTRELQESVMSVRMMPVSFVFNRFPRVVRDLSSRMHKSIDLQLEGGETEMDKSMIEKLVDPLTHLVRNSIDHGVESPQVRREKGKPEQGRVVLRAIQKGGNIVIEIEDDGAGLNREKILGKAKEQGLVLPENPTDEQVWLLILEPGFSTADEVTDVSGRGVGMDVVRRNLENLGGRLDIESFPGEGSRFTIQLPLTLAIIDGMGVKVGDQSFILPLVSIVESMRPNPENVKTLAQDDFLISVRDHYWPVIPLYRIMEAEAEFMHPAKGIVVLIETGRRRFALLVDELLGQQQVVIKSLEQNYRRVHGVAGATIMGDGSVALILDVESLGDDVKQIKPEEGLVV